LDQAESVSAKHHTRLNRFGHQCGIERLARDGDPPANLNLGNRSPTCQVHSLNWDSAALGRQVFEANFPQHVECFTPETATANFKPWKIRFFEEQYLATFKCELPRYCRASWTCPENDDVPDILSRYRGKPLTTNHSISVQLPFYH
jgi:hypothetical protein